MKTNPKDLLMDIAAKAMVSAGAVKSEGKTVTIVKPASFEQGWNLIKPGWSGKEVVDWKRNDILAYFYNCYFVKYGIYLANKSAFAFNQTMLTDVLTALEIQFKLDKCPMHLIKDYIDYFYERYCDSAIAQLSPKYTLSIMELKKTKYLRSFFLYKQNETKSFEVDFSTATGSKQVDTSGVSLDDLDNAYNIHGQYFCINYGIVLVVNYLMLIKGFTAEKAKQYIVKVLNKTQKDDIMLATKKYQPYPQWFTFTDISEFSPDILTISDTSAYDFLRSSKKQ